MKLLRKVTHPSINDENKSQFTRETARAIILKGEKSSYFTLLVMMTIACLAAELTQVKVLKKD